MTPHDAGQPSRKTPPRTFDATLIRIVAAVSVGFVVTQLDVTIVNIALAAMSVDLHASMAGLQWVSDAYMLAFAALMLSAGVLGERFGARRMYGAGMAVFALASLACGLAGHAATLIAARAVQGAGAAVMLPNSLALLNQSCGHDAPLRARAVGLWTAAGAISIAAGPVVGGVLIAALGWRSIFWVNLPLCAAGLLAVAAWVPNDRSDRHDGRNGCNGHEDTRAAHAAAAATHGAARPPAPARSLDPLGQCLAIVALAAFTGAVIEWRPLGWSNPVVPGGFALALAAAVAFVAWQARATQPMLPLALLRIRTFSVSVLFGICVNLAYYGTVFVLSLYLQRSRGETPLQAGLAFLPLTGGFLISNLASGWITARHGVRLPMLVGACIAALGFGLLHFVDQATPLPALLLVFLLMPLGMGLAVPAMTTAVLASVEPRRAGTASAVLNTARQAGGAAGVAAFGALAAGTGPAHIVAGMQLSGAISAAMLVAGIVLACLVDPHPRAGSAS